METTAYSRAEERTRNSFKRSRARDTSAVQQLASIFAQPLADGRTRNVEITRLKRRVADRASVPYDELIPSISSLRRIRDRAYFGRVFDSFTRGMDPAIVAVVRGMCEKSDGERG